MNSVCKNSGEFIFEEIGRLEQILKNRHKINNGILSEEELFKNIDFQSVPENKCVYSELLHFKKFTAEERVTLILAVIPHIAPSFFMQYDKQPVYFGGSHNKNQKSFIPTIETLLYILAFNDPVKKRKLLGFFESDHPFYKENLIALSSLEINDPEIGHRILATSDFVESIVYGKTKKPDFSINFPAKLIQTGLDWDEVILPLSTFNQLNEIELWLKHNKTLASDNKIGKKIKPGFRALFYGPPGTGKTLSACLIGKKTGRDVYRVDLSTIVSKYIGETEKNLAKLFDRAERKDWILFFDEADALFGKRTNVSDSHDRYANQEVSYLLQRIEYHEGLVILATNMKNNMDSAFLRRFQSIVYFPSPKPEERLLLWQKAFSDTIPPDKNIALADIAKKYELSGSLILNIVSHTTLKAINENSSVITNSMLMEGIARELAKEGRTV